jgi:hypothetical protein
VNVDNQAFAAEFEEAAGDGLQTEGVETDPTPYEGQEGEDQQATTSTVPGSRGVNVFDYEVPTFDGENGSGREMQEKSGPGFLGGSDTAATVPRSASKAWDEMEEDKESSSHVEQTR